MNTDLEDTGRKDLIKEGAEKYSREAEILLNYGRNTTTELEHIISILFLAISFTPKEFRVHTLLAEAYLRSLDLSSAIFSLRLAFKLEPSNSRIRYVLFEVLVLSGLEIFREHNYTRASYRFGEALKIESAKPKVWIFKAICHIRLSEFKEALDATSRALHLSASPSAELYIMRAKIFWALGFVDQGNKDIKQASHLDPKHPEVISFTTRSFAESEVLYQLGMKSFEKRDFEAAKSFIRRAMEVTPEDLKLFIILSKIDRLSGDYDNAFINLKRAALMFEQKSGGLPLPEEISKQMNLVMNDMALKLSSVGDFEKALVLLRKVIDSERRLRTDESKIDYRYIVNEGDCYRALERGSEALNSYRQALKLSPENWEIKVRMSMTHYILASKAFNDCQYMDAEHELSYAIDLNPKVSEYYATRGKARYYQGDFQGAYADFTKALELNPNNPDILARIGQFDSNLVGNGINKSDSNDRLQSKADGVAKVTDEDIVHMMLNPHKARRSRSHSHSNGIKSAPARVSGSSSDCTRILSQRDPGMAAAVKTLAVVAQKERSVQQLFHQPFESAKDPLWCLINDSTKLASQRKLTILQRKSVDTKLSAAVTPGTLKRISEEISRKARQSNNVVITGTSAKKVGDEVASISMSVSGTSSRDSSSVYPKIHRRPFVPKDSSITVVIKDPSVHHSRRLDDSTVSSGSSILSKFGLNSPKHKKLSILRNSGGNSSSDKKSVEVQSLGSFDLSRER